VILTRLIVTPATTVFRFLSSLKTAIPLLVLTIVVTVVGSLFPQPDLFKSWWYLGLLALNGVSLLFITIVHIPMILERKGRNALIGVVVTHLGILILIVGAIYGSLSGFRHTIKVIEGEVTVVPGLAFAVQLDRLVLENYPAESIAHMNFDVAPKKRQDSHLSLYKDGKPWLKLVTAPGSPVSVDGIKILPAIQDIGWYFELEISSADGRSKTIPVRPWSPPLIKVGSTEIMAHSLMETGSQSVQIFTIESEQMKLLGLVTENTPLVVDDVSIALGQYKRYTGLAIYNRPQAPLLVAGCLAMLFGLIWHFYHRHRDRSTRKKGDTPNV
jgi:cytochrome c biogenesis protein ResB